MSNINNTVMLRGYLAKPIALSYYKNKEGEKKAIGKFTLAVKNGKDVDFIPITIFNGSAETLAKYSSTGTQLLVAGSVKTTEYEKTVKGKKETQKIYGLEVIANNGFEFLSSPKANNNNVTENA